MIDIPTLCRRWIHSKEEDTPTETVYRPADFAFPPSRGRKGLEFKADGRFKRVGIGRSDASAVTEGTWRISDDGDAKIQVDADNSPEELTLRSVDDDRLVIRKGG